MGLEHVELFIRVEEEIGIELPEEDLAEATTPQKLIDFICGQDNTLDRDQVAAAVRDELLALLRLAPEKYVEDGDFISHYGMG